MLLKNQEILQKNLGRLESVILAQKKAIIREDTILLLLKNELKRCLSVNNDKLLVDNFEKIQLNIGDYTENKMKMFNTINEYLAMKTRRGRNMYLYSNANTYSKIIALLKKQVVEIEMKRNNDYYLEMIDLLEKELMLILKDCSSNLKRIAEIKSINHDLELKNDLLNTKIEEFKNKKIRNEETIDSLKIKIRETRKQIKICKEQNQPFNFSPPTSNDAYKSSSILPKNDITDTGNVKPKMDFPTSTIPTSKRPNSKIATRPAHIQLKNKLAVMYETIYYTIMPIPVKNDELVKGKKGYHYDIEFKNPTTEKTIFFDLEQYTIDDFDKEFLKSINEFYKEVIGVLDKGAVQYEIFIQGSADIDDGVQFIGNKDSEYNFNQVDVLTKGSNNKYEFSKVTKSIPPKFGNIHLPNLRGEFIREKLVGRPFDKIKPERVHLLDGFVVDKINPSDRKVNITLYVKWINI